jgi:hypothetical protein
MVTLRSSRGESSYRLSSRRRWAAVTAGFSVTSACMTSSNVCIGRFALKGSREKSKPST